MGLFVTRYLTSLLIFVLGLKAPGITFPYNAQVPVDEENQPLITENNGSAFRNAFKKLRKLFPYLWPKKDVVLQITVLFCLLLLAAGRVIKLFLPIYRKKLGKFIYFNYWFLFKYIKLTFLFSCISGGQWTV